MFWTILTIHLGAVDVSIRYPSERACGDAMMVVVNDTGLARDYPYLWVQCKSTGAPSVVDVRPKSRGNDDE